MKPLLFSAALLTLALPAPANNWPQTRGPNRDSVSTDAAVPTHWSEKENLKWQLDLPGAGASSPIVWENKVFVTCFSGQKENGDVSGLVRHILCVDKATGKKLWQRDYPTTQKDDDWSGMIREHGYTSNTPVTDGAHVYVHWGKGGVVALDMDGKEVWKATTGSESGRQRWGSSGSPVLWKNLLIVNAADEAQSVIAFDKATGKQAWKQTAGLLEGAFSSPQVLKRADGREDLIFAAPSELWGMNPETGKLRWYAPTGIEGNVAPDPVIQGEDIYVFGGFPSTMRVALKAGDKGEVSSSAMLWQDSQSTYVPTPVYHDGKLYVVSDQGFAWCADAKTGAMIYRERLGGAAAQSGGGGGRRGGGKPFYASPVLIGDKIYAVSRKQGVFILAAKPQFQVLATNFLAGDGTDFNATPAVSDGCLFLRSNKALYCIGK
ncbi:PQQ-binding-like beta-propeller repeat protein [Roseimicrobium sp. ORNL1]|uniref:PQQ-binding-like beta-propeller repeat protein n=1 Tax=Roseimicrobium sp. ORNL1 TaxID=2711231 RepID=UPI0013E10A06|nr:PQQ-binding-like beta-propeller repeat protein [Roseimicrobium sp. ORNL1]QIF05720.1 PQQ-binding-like beta-propeller repeat protein [Roseimicrobium sp. ORNL1]